MHLLTNSNSCILVDEENGAIRGYVLVLFRKGHAKSRLYSIAVDPNCQGKGIGRGLLEAAEQEAKKRGIKRMGSEIRFDNEASQALFKRAGYRQIGRVEDYYSDRMGALVFEKSLE
jgi:ribosomal protein S18 acetylase RimI-like enzyme